MGAGVSCARMQGGHNKRWSETHGTKERDRLELDRLAEPFCPSVSHLSDHTDQVSTLGASDAKSATSAAAGAKVNTSLQVVDVVQSCLVLAPFGGVYTHESVIRAL